MVSLISKPLLCDTYNRRITNGDQIIPLLTYELHGSVTFRADMEPVVPRIKAALARYLRGTGHPVHPNFDADNLIDPATRELDDRDPGYRARRFVKLLSGLSYVPAYKTQLFKVCFLVLSLIYSQFEDVISDCYLPTSYRCCSVPWRL